MSMINTRSLVVAFAALAVVSTSMSAQAVAVVRPAPTPPANRITLSNDDVKTIIAAKHPALLNGTTEDNTLIIVLASNGAYVLSGTSKAAGGTVVRAARAPSAPVATDAATPTATIAPTMASREGKPGLINFPGVGDIDATLIQDMYGKAYEAGEVSLNALRVRFVTLKGNSLK
jgi:hypothetical protein